MDYRKIYSDFIAHRKSIESDLDGYFETHHILPRSLGGTDDAENLIRLTPEDHFFAHLLLARIHNNRAMWGACMLMMGSKHAGAGRFTIRRKLTRYRASYGVIRRAYSAASQGINGANADLSLYDFYHFDGRHFRGTRIDFGTRFGVGPSSVNQMVTGKSASTSGWCLSREEADTLLERRTANATAAGKSLKGFSRRPQLFCFYHIVDGRSVIANQKGMKALGLLDRTAVSALCSGKRFLANGWCLIENADWAGDRANKRGEYCGAFKGDVHSFTNSLTGHVVEGTIWSMGQAYADGDSRPFGAIVSGARNGYKGWHLAGTPAPIARRLDRRFICGTTGKAIVGSVTEVARILGVSQSAVSKHVTGKAPHVRGYKLWQNPARAVASA